MPLSFHMCFIKRWLTGWFLKVSNLIGLLEILIALSKILLTTCTDQLTYNLGLIKLCSACTKQNAAINAGDACSSLPKIYLCYYQNRYYKIFLSLKWAWCKIRTRTPGSGTSGPWDLRPPAKFKSGTSGLPSKFKSWALRMIFLHCLTCFVLDKYIICNMEIIFHE